jgi:hypothetical protein
MGWIAQQRGEQQSYRDSAKSILIAWHGKLEWDEPRHSLDAAVDSTGIDHDRIAQTAQLLRAWIISHPLSIP